MSALPAIPTSVSEPVAVPSAADEAAAYAGGLVLRAAEGLQGFIEPSLEATGVNTARYVVLNALESTGEFGCTQTVLAARLKLSESNLSTLLVRMEQDGLVLRQRSGQDRRKQMIRLTEQGRQVLAQARQHRTAALSLALGEWPAADQQACVAGLESLLSRWVHNSASTPRTPLRVVHGNEMDSDSSVEAQAEQAPASAPAATEPAAPSESVQFAPATQHMDRAA